MPQLLSSLTEHNTVDWDTERTSWAGSVWAYSGKS